MSMKKIIKNAVVVYTDDVNEQFDAIRITDRGLIIGRIIDGEFVACGFIPQRNIKNVNNGTKRKSR